VQQCRYNAVAKTVAMVIGGCRLIAILITAAIVLHISIRGRPLRLHLRRLTIAYDEQSCCLTVHFSSKPRLNFVIYTHFRLRCLLILFGKMFVETVCEQCDVAEAAQAEWVIEWRITVSIELVFVNILVSLVFSRKCTSAMAVRNRNRLLNTAIGDKPIN